MKKNDLIELSIEDIGSEGLGIGHFEGMAVFVKDTVIGDRITARVMLVKKNLAFARLQEILEPGSARIVPPCPIASACGGCQIQAMSYEAQLAFKTRLVKNTLHRIGGLEEAFLDEITEPIIGMEEDPWHYRNKAQFPIGRGRDGKPVAGFFAGRTHSIIPVQDCLIGIPENKPILEMILSWMGRFSLPAYDEASGQGMVRHVFIRKGFSTGQIVVVLVINAATLPDESRIAADLVQQLRLVPGVTGLVLNENRERTNVILGRKNRVLWGTDVIEDQIGDLTYRISPHSFFQVNPVQTRKLYERALEYAGLTGSETVWDIYCGIGTISLFLARKAKQVYGVEVVEAAVENARENARLNGITNAEFYTGQAEQILPEKYRTDRIKADVMVVDPPRKGCDKSVLETMAAMQPDRIVYISCDPATLARDLKILAEERYKPSKISICDMFCHSVHVEIVVLLTRNT